MKLKHTATPVTQTVVVRDCIEHMAAMAAQSVDLVCTSPPYPGMGMPYGDKFTEAKYVEFCRDWLGQAARVLKATGSIWINVGYMIGDDKTRIPLTYLLWPLIRELGLYFRQEVVWMKPHRGAYSTNLLTNRSERWMWLTKVPTGYTFNLDAVRIPASENKSQDPRNNPSGKNPGDVWEFAAVNGNAKNRPDHPCPFPQPIIERVIRGWSNPGDVVLDPFGGSGTTALVAMKLGRCSVSVEQKADYAVGAANRIIDWQASEIERLKAELAALRASNDPDLSAVIPKCRTLREAIQALGWGVYSTTKINRLRKLAEEQGVSLDHFVGKAWRRPATVTKLPVRDLPASHGLRVLDLFSGVGGMSLGLRQHGGFETTAFAEIDKHCRGVLARHWPTATIHGDVRNLRIKPGEFDVLTGGFPCTDISVIGKRKGLNGTASRLWYEFERLIQEGRPRYVVVENSEALRHRGLGEILRSLDALGYYAEWHCIPASAVGAPHRRDRLWLLAYPKGAGDQCDSSGASLQHFVRFPAGVGAAGVGEFRGCWEAEPRMGRVADGLSGRVDARRRRALGNAVVPQIVTELIAPAIYRIEAVLRDQREAA